MKNFEEAVVLIEKLKSENQELKKRINDLTGTEIDIQVNSDYKVERMRREADAAMKKFTEKLRNESEKFKEKCDA